MNGEFDKIEQHADQHWWYVGMRKTALAILDRFVPDQRPLRVLEIGCGTGVNLAHLARYGSVKGIEYDRYALALAQRKGYSCAWGDMHRLDIASEGYDLISFFEVLYQAERGTHVSILESIRRALAPGGLVMLREPAMECLRGNHDLEWSTSARFSRREIEALFAAAGFEALYIGYANLLLLPIVFAKRRLESLLGAKAESDFHAHSPPVNAVLLMILSIERFLLRFLRFPVGVSIIAVGRKPAPADSTPAQDQM